MRGCVRRAESSELLAPLHVLKKRGPIRLSYNLFEAGRESQKVSRKKSMGAILFVVPIHGEEEATVV